MDVETLKQVSGRASLPGTDIEWLRETRDRALEIFAEHGLPTTADEDWRYTDLTPVRELLQDYAARQPAEDSTDSYDAAGAYPGQGAFLVFVNGRYRSGLSRLTGDKGLSVSSFSAGTPEACAAVASRLQEPPGSEAAGMAAFKTSLLRDGLVIEVAPGASVGDPVYVMLTGTGGHAAHVRLLVRLGAGSSATIIVHQSGDGLSTCNTTIECAGRSRLSYIKLQEADDTSCHLGAQHIRLGPDSSAELLHLDIGARLARNDLHVELAGAGSQVHASGLFFADGERHMDNHTRLDHLAPHTRSQEIYRGIMDGHGRGVFNGKIIVHPGADKTDAQLRNQNLLLSGTAEVDTKPELEIYADDVKCGHGATTGQLDKNAVFYLRSRGIPEREARRLLIASFAREIIRRLPSGPLEEHVVSALDRRLPGLAAAGQAQ